ncbi:MAG: hypothetical protein MJ131_04170 [Lachnospiraceae bacterium]|nr:hypothetical protein [Lachnospiraceae bacterium]
MITALIEVREMILKIYQKTRFVVNPLVKFILSWIVFAYINSEIGFDPRFTKTIIVLGMSAVCAFTPGAVLVFFAMMLTLLHIYSVSIFLAILLLLVFMLLYGFMLRFSAKYVAVSVAIPVLAKYNLHYCVPIMMGSVANPITILPTACGVIIYYVMAIVKENTARTVQMELDDIVQLYTDVFDAIIDNKRMIVVACVFALVITVVWFLRKFSFDYAFEISIAAGVVVNIIGFLFSELKYGTTVNIGVLIFMSLVSGVIAMLCDYMKRVLDYTGIERVQFEDDDYYYYVKAVPKVNISLREIDIKHINRKSVDGEDYEYEEETEDDDYESDVAFGDSDRSGRRSSYNDDFEDGFEDDAEDILFADDNKKKSLRELIGMPKKPKKAEKAPVLSDYERQSAAKRLTADVEDEGFSEDDDVKVYEAASAKRENPYLLKAPSRSDVNLPVRSDAKPVVKAEPKEGRVFLNDEGDYEEEMTLDDD